MPKDFTLNKVYSNKSSKDIGWFDGLNHQTVGNRDHVDTRITPHKLWNIWNTEYGPFTLDAAANATNTKCKKFFDINSNGLIQPWDNETVWCNPPYTDLLSWVIKAKSEIASLCKKVVMLIPANRTEQPFWQKHIEPYRDKNLGVKTVFISGRVQFGTEDEPSRKGAPPFGCVLIIFYPHPS